MKDWTFDLVRYELVEAVRMSWRMPSGGGPRSSSWASDAPWFLLTAKARASAAFGRNSDYAEWEATRQEIERQAIKDLRNTASTVPLTAEEVTWMEERLAWLERIGDADRKLVWLALVQLAGGGQVDWARIRSKLPLEIGRKGLYRRFVRALQGLAQSLNALERRSAA